MMRINLVKIILVISIVAIISSTIQAASLAEAERGVRPRSKGRTACACPRMYQPICGSDGVTYGNDCTFRCASLAKSGLTMKKRSECDSDGDDVEIEEIMPFLS